MNDNEYQVYLETRLRNLERRYVKLTQHADLIEEALETKKEIEDTKKELHDMQ